MSEWSEFGGVIGRYRNESTPWWPDPVRAPAGAPNVLVVLLDDVGFAQLGCFGSDIATPTFDRLSANGLRYTNFHTTALCSPTRACLLTGRNHHKVGMGRITDLAAVDPDKPFFLYLCTGACHSPHHAPPEWIERYRGHFDAGWDVWREATFARQQELGLLPEGTELSPRPEWVPAWDSLPPDEQRVAARYMECFAAFLSHA